MKGRGEAAAVARVYAVGDIHGRYDLFAQLMRIIGRDQAARAPVATRIVLLGNIVDHGPHAARMVRGCMALTASTDRFRVLKGSGEDMMVEGLRGDLAWYADWLDAGGRATLRSFGADRRVSEGPATAANCSAAAQAVGEDVIRWLAALPLHDRHGDHLFVHAGIRPGVPIEAQAADDLLYIGDEFLRSKEAGPLTVVHGHATDTSGPVFRPGRIGIDTGAWRTERLTALGVEDGEVWTLSTAAPLMAALVAMQQGGRAAGGIGR